ncbi:MAG: L,D-transpeptidase family protein [Burkholderiaceae bacterium]|nr:L,D-transpeptidase family protein [Burkholderiaceae bacterium]
MPAARSQPSASLQPQPSPDPAVASVLATVQAAPMVPRGAPLAARLQAVYRENRGRLLWAEGYRPGAAVPLLHAVLAAASRHGLDPAEYRSEWIAGELAAWRDGRIDGPQAIARLDVTMTLALLRYLSDLRDGRAAQRQISGTWQPAPALSSEAMLAAAARDADALRRLLDRAAPGYPDYHRLLQARSRLEAMVVAGREPPRFPPGTTLRAGDRSPLVAALAARLAELGDLAASASTPDVYEDEVVEAVRRFQRRHGLADDGVAGPATLAAVQVPNRARLRQVDLALERLRWLPPITADRVIAINIPDFRLWAYDRTDDGRVRAVLESNVVVGRQGRTPTPVFIAQLNAVDFNPYWNVPYSIARGETVPRLRRDPAYLEREGMEFVAADGTVSRQVTAANLDAVAQGRMRIRQRPGPRNALGKVKLTMPNTMNIYLHDTPSRGLFAQTRRDFSHGCIRVEKVVELATFALSRQAGWDARSIDAALQGSDLRVARVAPAIPVVVFYTTAVAGEDGMIRFLPDLYGFDRKLDAVMPPSVVGG